MSRFEQVLREAEQQRMANEREHGGFWESYTHARKQELLNDLAEHYQGSRRKKPGWHPLIGRMKIK